MKRILFFLFLSLPALLYAQENIVSDTSYIESRSGVFWQVQRQAFADGRVRTEETPLGSDTVRVANAVVGPAFQTFQQYGERAAFVQANYARQRQVIGAVNGSLNSLLGQTYFTAIGNAIGNDFIGQYTIRVNGGQPIQVEILRLQSGALRFQQGGTNFVLDIFSRNWMRIRRYQGTSTQTPDTSVVVDLFFDLGTGTWIDMSTGLGNIRYRLRKS